MGWTLGRGAGAQKRARRLLDGATGHGGCGELDPQAALLAADAGARSATVAPKSLIYCGLPTSASLDFNGSTM